MWALLKREINGFFNSLIAYVVVSVFLLTISLFLWVFPAEFNIIESGVASLEGLFVLGPFVYLFLVPAITMRFFADEIRTGTIEMLLTKPLTDLDLVMAKYLAGIFLVVVSLLPTLIYLATVVVFASPPGVDMGGSWGSYLGLLFLGMVFVAVGLYASTLTENQIVSFIVALFLCGFLFVGFEMIHSLSLFGRFDYVIRNLGLYAHYTSMSRGVVDSRDVLYFAGMIVVFLAMAHARTGRRKGVYMPVLNTLAIIAIVVAVNLAGSWRFARLDLTSEKRYTLTAATRSMLRDLDDIVYFRVYLDGNLPVEFRRLRNNTREMLDEFRAWSDHVQFEFINPSAQAGDDPDEQRRIFQDLAEKGLDPAQVQMRSGDGTSQRVIFPGALVSYRDKEVPLTLLDDHLGLSIDEILHNSTMALEYKLASVIRQLSTEEKHRVAFLGANGELPRRHLASFAAELENFYEVSHLDNWNSLEQLIRHKTLISAQPREAFTEEQKFLLDQFLMQGGSMLWMVDPVFAEMDSLRVAPETVGIAWPINMDDFFFRYGVRLNPVLLKDLHAAPHPFTTGEVAGRPQINLLPWNYFPLLTSTSDHPIVRNLNLIRAQFISSIDTVEVQNVAKHVLLTTSAYTRIMPVPVRISMDILQRGANESLYSDPPQAVAVLLEGHFTSLFRNRILPAIDLPDNFQPMDEGHFARMIVVADGNMARNQFGQDGRPLPLGYDRFSRQTFGNADFLLNAVNYLTDDAGLLEARGRDIRIRLLDTTRARQQQTKIQLVNTVLPIIMVLAFGLVRMVWRKRHYTKA